MLDRPQTVRRTLAVLEDLGLVRRERNYEAAPRTSWRNRIADNAVLFWYRFVHPNRSRLETGGAEEVWSDRVAPGLAAYMGGVFEGICREAYGSCHARWGFAGARRWSRWEGVSRDRRPIEIDIVADLDDGTFLTSEINWSSRALDYDQHVHLVRDLEDLARSGHRWAARALSRKGYHLYVSADGFTEHFRQRAAEHGRIHLATLPDLY